jgi:hypothetical protein
VRLSVFAVFRLITSSNFVACSTGREESKQAEQESDHELGLSPDRMTSLPDGRLEEGRMETTTYPGFLAVLIVCAGDES